MAPRDSAYVGLVVLALTSHAINLADAALTLIESGRPVEAAALLRQVIETAWTAVWVEAYGSTAARALIHEQARNSLNTVQAFVKAGTSATDEEVAELNAALDGLGNAASPSGRTFEARCEDIEGGKRVYAMYRALSQYSHASVVTVDLYVHQIRKTEQWPLGLGISPRPEADGFDSLFDLAPVMLIHACLAWSRIDKTRAQRTRLKELARLYDINPRNQKTVIGLKREHDRQRAEKAARREARPPRDVAPKMSV